MKTDEPSRTALMIARQRTAHQVLDHGSILNDPFAMKILPDDRKDVLQFANQHPLAGIGRLFTAAPSRIAEDTLSRAVETGVRHIVILGAGLDTFALRNPHVAQQIRIYEVDHPATQAWKRRLFAEAQIALPAAHSRQSVSSGTIWERLAAVSFDGEPLLSASVIREHEVLRLEAIKVLKMDRLHVLGGGGIVHLTSARLKLWRAPCRMWSTSTRLLFSVTR